MFLNKISLLVLDAVDTFSAILLTVLAHISVGTLGE
jgi:hypothetical protein